MSRRIAKRLARVRRHLRQESPPRDSGPDAQSVYGRVDENGLNRTNTLVIRNAGEAREPRNPVNGGGGYWIPALAARSQACAGCVNLPALRLGRNDELRGLGWRGARGEKQ